MQEYKPSTTVEQAKELAKEYDPDLDIDDCVFFPTTEQFTEFLNKILKT